METKEVKYNLISAFMKNKGDTIAFYNKDVSENELDQIIQIINKQYKIEIYKLLEEKDYNELKDS